MERAARGPSENSAELRLFGALDVVERGVVRPFAAGRKAPQVLAYLALAHARSVTREQLAGILWPDCDERTARGYLRRSLYELSIARLPGREPWVAVRGESLSWNNACGVAIDVARFEHAATPDEVADSLGWYRGDLLEGWYDDWVLTRREELRQTLAGRLRELVRRRTREGDVRGALSFADGLLRVEPFDEETVRAAMALQRQIGDRAGALGRYEAFRRALRREMQIDPMPETQALEQRIRSDETLAVPAPERAARTTRGRAPLLPFVGRDAALAQFADEWARTLDARGGVTFISRVRRARRSAGRRRLLGRDWSLGAAPIRGAGGRPGRRGAAGSRRGHRAAGPRRAGRPRARARGRGRRTGAYRRE
jgi:DNA-binding SARP family transcriptional activator